MHRRTFMSLVGGLGFAAQAQEPAKKRTRYYVIEQFLFRNGGQVPRFHELVSKGLLPAIKAIHPGVQIYLEAMVAPHLPQAVAIYGFGSLEEIAALDSKLWENAELVKLAEQWEASDTGLEQQINTVIEATGYSPEVVPLDPPPETPRVFELRVYHSPTWRQLDALNARFAGPEIKIFHRCGIHPVLYGATLFGANMPNLTYLIPFANLAEREKAWRAFGADPEWVKVRNESIEKHGQVAGPIQVALYNAAKYSPVR